MIPLPLTITRAGMAKFTAAQLTAGLDLTIAAVGLTDQAIVAAPTLTALPGEFRRLTMVSGKQVGDAIVHMTMRDDADIGYTARGIGLFLADGTLFATYGQAEALFQKSARATFFAAVDITFPTSDITRLTFGATDFLNPPATTETMGVVELATLAEGKTGTDTRRVPPVSVVTALLLALEISLRDLVDRLASAVTEATDGLAARTIFGSGLVKGGGRNDTNRTVTVDAASATEVRLGTAADKAVTPKALADARTLYVVESREGYRSLSDGTIEQWGIADIGRTVEGVFTLTFPSPFPNECQGVFTMTRNLNTTDQGLTSIQELALYADRASLYAQNHTSALNETGGFRWRAWGR